MTRQSGAPPSAAELAFRRALDSHRHGRLQEAEQHCRAALRLQPTSPDALHLLGLIGLQAGQPEAGIRLIQQSLALNPKQPLAYSNLGAALRDLNRPV